jgi:hypothetical protein
MSLAGRYLRNLDSLDILTLNKQACDQEANGIRLESKAWNYESDTKWSIISNRQLSFFYLKNVHQLLFANAQ